MLKGFSKSENLEFLVQNAKCYEAKLFCMGALDLTADGKFMKKLKSMKERKPMLGIEPISNLFGPNGFFQISYTPIKTDAKQQLVQDAFF
jgi:hypothetical protein